MKKKHHTHISQHDSQRQIRDAIAWQGFALRHVLASAKQPAFSYTVGLHTPGSAKPELFISGLQTATRVAWLLALGFEIAGPPPLATRQQMARAQGVPPEALPFPAGGRVFQPGTRYPDLAGKDLSTFFAEVDPKHFEAFFGQALVFHGSHTFPILQILWPDTHGVFPWEPSFDEQWRPKQQLLYEPQRFQQQRASAR